MMDRNDSTRTYEPPTLIEYGTVHALTQTQDKKYGESDGFTFMGTAITNASS
jgi:hypothetical protein